MSILGLTPIDSALSAVGLNIAYLITNLICHGTHIAAFVFILGLLLNIWRTARSGSFRPLIVFIFICITIILVFLPSANEGQIQSASEAYGARVETTSLIKNQMINIHQAPTVLTFLVLAATSIEIGVFHSIDMVMPAWAKYLNSPFEAHRSLLLIKRFVESGIGKTYLDSRLSNFLYDEYLPAVNQLKNLDSSVNITQFWPGHARIIPYYSQSAKQQWDDINTALIGFLEHDSVLLGKGIEAVAKINESTPQDTQNVLIRSIITNKLTSEQHSPLNNLSWLVSGWVHDLFFYAYGFLSMTIYATTPFLMVAVALTGLVQILLCTLKAFLWLKLTSLIVALGFYSSILIARLQVQSSSDLSWSWTHPYFSVFSAATMLIAPVISYLIVNIRRST